MKQSRIRFLGILALALTTATTGCDSNRAAAPLTGPSADLAVTGRKYHVVKGARQRADSTVAIIGYWGGKMKLDNNSLDVPIGAVRTATRFTMKYIPEAVDAGYLGVDLSATQTAADGSTVAAGVSANPFRAALSLKLDYSSATEILDPANVVVVYLLDGTVTGSLEEQPSWVVQNSKFITATITHFSGYAVGAG